MKYELHNGDCVEILKSMPSGSVDLILTDPPYLYSNGGELGKRKSELGKRINAMVDNIDFMSNGFDYPNVLRNFALYYIE